MNPRYLLDTNICIFIRRNKPQAVLERFKTVRVGDVGMSVITHGELAFGVRKAARENPSHEDQAALNFLRLQKLIPAIPLDAQVADTYGTIRNSLEAAGTKIGNNDLWIAAHALSIGATLVTNNRREFDRVPLLVVEDWTV